MVFAGSAHTHWVHLVCSTRHVGVHNTLLNTDSRCPAQLKKAVNIDDCEGLTPHLYRSRGIGVSLVCLVVFILASSLWAIVRCFCAAASPSAFQFCKHCSACMHAKCL